MIRNLFIVIKFLVSIILIIHGSTRDITILSWTGIYIMADFIYDVILRRYEKR